MVDDEDREGFERREDAKEEVEDEEVGIEEALAAALLSCRRECEIRARSTLGGRGKVDGADSPEVPIEMPLLLPLMVKLSPHVSSSALLFRFFCAIFIPLVLPELSVICPISDPPLAPKAIPKKDGGRSESESSGFCSR